MNITAEIKYLRISPKKLKALSKVVIGLSPQNAIDRLLLVSDKAGKLMLSVIKSAQANAQNNLKLNAATLKIKTVEILKGPTMKRWQPVSKGMAHQIKKRMSHIKVVLISEEKEPVKKLETPKKGKS